MADQQLQQVMSSGFLLVGLIVVAAVGVGIMLWLRRRLASEREGDIITYLHQAQGAAFGVALLSELQSGTAWKNWTAIQWQRLVVHANAQLSTCPSALRASLSTVVNLLSAQQQDVMIKHSMMSLIELLKKMRHH
jgi:hypothetical protein